MSKITMRAKMQVNKVERFPGQDRIDLQRRRGQELSGGRIGRRQQLCEVQPVR